MKKILRQLILYILPIFFFTACEKELSYEAGTSAGTAIFSFDGGTGNCTGAVVSGSYTAGVALGAGNTVALSVNVATAGTYTITTSTVNGVSFSGAGSFATNGIQIITLAAAGTPTTSGNFTFTPGTAGCNFSVTVASGSGASSGTASFTYGGGTGNCTGVVFAGAYTAGIALTAANTVKLQVTVDTIGTYTISTASVNGILFTTSGTFTATGLQTITLTGTGIPAVAGTFNFTAGSGGCSFDIAVITGGGSNTDFLQCKIDGVLKTFNVNLLATVPVTTGFSIDGQETNAAVGPTLSLALNNLLGTVTTGTYNLVTLAAPTVVFCFPVYDDGSVISSQSNDPSLPSTFSVIVTSKTANRITGTFSGTLYDNDGSGPGTKVFTEGAFSVPY